MSSLSLSQLQAPKGEANKSPKRVGRGGGSGLGTTAGRGTKGQRARNGGGNGLKKRSLRKRLMSMPQLPGFTSMYKKPAVVNLSDLEKHFSANDVISPKKLFNKGLINTPRYGVKVLMKGDITKSVTVLGCAVSLAVKEKIEKVGGQIK